MGTLKAALRIGLTFARVAFERQHGGHSTKLRDRGAREKS
jgi:hypothetical protein